MTRHVHADLYEEAVNDLSIKWQVKVNDNWVDLHTRAGGIIHFDPIEKYRKKPREFQEDHINQS